MSSVLKLVVIFLSAFAASGADVSQDFAPTVVLPQTEQNPVTTSLNETSGSWHSYKQCDSSWSSQQLGTCSQTICSAGCAMTSVAMILKTKGADYNPSTLDKWLTKNGGYANGCEIYWGKVDSLGKTSYQGMETASESAICSGLSKGHGIVANVHNGGHWVLLTGCLGNGKYSVNDPGFSTTSYSHSEILREAVYH